MTDAGTWRQRLMLSSPAYRIQAHRRFWGAEAPEHVAEQLDLLERWLTERGDIGAKGLMMLQALDHARTIYEWNTDPDTLRGEKTLHHARTGHERAHGTSTEKQKRWQEYREALEKQLERRPNLSVTEARRRVAESYGVSLKTIVKRTKDINKN